MGNLINKDNWRYRVFNKALVKAGLGSPFCRTDSGCLLSLDAREEKGRGRCFSAPYHKFGAIK